MLLFDQFAMCDNFRFFGLGFVEIAWKTAAASCPNRPSDSPVSFQAVPESLAHSYCQR
jgi:hypothetical protein